MVKKIGEILIDNNLLTEADLKKALKVQKSMSVHKPLGEVLIDLDLITIDSLMDYLEIQLNQHKM